MNSFGHLSVGRCCASCLYFSSPALPKSVGWEELCGEEGGGEVFELPSQSRSHTQTRTHIHWSADSLLSSVLQKALQFESFILLLENTCPGKLSNP